VFIDRKICSGFWESKSFDFEVISDASFADNSIDRRSSQAYAMKLFGGMIERRANKQDIVGNNGN
jgi:hypothetical protein